MTGLPLEPTPAPRRRRRTTRIADCFRWLASEGPLVLAFIVFSVGVLVLAIGTLVDERNESQKASDFEHQIQVLEFEAECRFRLAAPVDRISAEKLDALASGLVAVVEEDDAALAAVTMRIRQLQAEERDALEVREGAAEECNDRAEDLFG